MITGLRVGDTILVDGEEHEVTAQELQDVAAKRHMRVMLASGVRDADGQEIHEADVVQVFMRKDQTGPSYFAYVVFTADRGFLLRNAQDLPLSQEGYTLRVWANFYAQPHWVEQFAHHRTFIQEHWY